MNRRAAISTMLAIVAATPFVAAHAQRGGGIFGTMEAGAPAVPAPRNIAYGSDPMQSLDLWMPAAATAPVPLVVFVHGGAWAHGNKDNGTGKWKESHFPAQGYAFATLDYRLVPEARVEDQADDIAHALRTLIDRADALGFDKRRIVLMGHSAGAHLVALVSTDPQYLARVSLPMSALAGTIAIDGAGYDVPQQVAGTNGYMHHEYVQAFGIDPARQRALSPTFQASAPNVARFLLLHVQRPDGIAQADELAAALRQGGAQVQETGFPGQGLIGHLTINRRLGDPTYPATPVVDQWLARVFAR